MSAKRWVVDAAEQKLEAILERMAEPRALGEGRAFVNGARAAPETAVALGDVVEVWAGRAAFDGSIDVLHRTADWIAVDKPAALPTIPDHRGADSLVARVSAMVGADAHAISRLDVGVSGVVILATSTEGRRVLDEATRTGALEKSYVGIVKGLLGDAGRVTTPIDGKPAATRYRAIARARAATLAAFELETGRLHQIREHAAALRTPLYGDKKRRGPASVTASDGRVVALDRILLHAFRASLPQGSTRVEIRSPIPAALVDTWATLDGDAAAWEAI